MAPVKGSCGRSRVAPLTIWCLLCGCLPLALTSSPQPKPVHHIQHGTRPVHDVQQQSPAAASLPAAPAAMRHVASQQQAAAAAAAAAAGTSGPLAVSSSTSSSNSTPAALQVQHSRQLLHLEAMESIDTADTAEVVEVADHVNAYPRGIGAVQKYLLEALRNGPQEVPVWFVVVTDPREPRSIISQPQAEQQIQLLNRAYATGLPDRSGVVSEDAAASAGSRQLWRFKLMGVKYTSSKNPMCIGSKMEDQVKSAWHPQLVEATRNAAGQRGGAAAEKTLIIYTSDLTSPACKGYVPGYKALFGWSNTPMELQAWKQRHQAYRDGVVLDFRYLYHADSVAIEAGGKSLRGASTGAQLVHEVGHYLGLLHTFVGGCGSGAAMTDGVDDTPQEAHPRAWGVDLGDASGGCARRDTCPGDPGDDAVQNYMSYNNLACAAAFTPGQQARMLYLFSTMRAGTTH